MVKEVNDALAAVLDERGLDGRVCYVHVALLPPDGWTVELECSEASVADEVVRRLDLSGDAARRLRVTRLPSAGIPAEMIVSNSVADVRRSPSHPSELVSQAVMGDRVRPLKTEGDWLLVRMEDGYIGWIRSWHLTERAPADREAFQARALHRIAANHSEVLSDPSADSLPVSDLVIGTPVVVTASASHGWVGVELPDARTGFVREHDVELLPAGRPVSREQLVATGLRFLGIPYLWGGSTPKGFDCSGLVQRIFRLQGVILPRDSDQQVHFGREKWVTTLDDLVPGDLLFFGRAAQRVTHVAMALPGREFLHAYGQVRVNSLDPDHPRFEPSLARDWRATRDPLVGE